LEGKDRGAAEIYVSENATTKNIPPIFGY